MRIIKPCYYREGTRLPLSLITLSTGETFFAQHMIPENLDKNALAFVEELDGDSKCLTALTELLLEVEGLHDSRRGAFHIRFARADIFHPQGVESLRLVSALIWPKMRIVMHKTELPTLSWRGGFRGLIYKDLEIAIGDYSYAGSFGWIVPKSKISEYQKLLNNS